MDHFANNNYMPTETYATAEDVKRWSNISHKDSIFDDLVNIIQNFAESAQGVAETLVQFVDNNRRNFLVEGQTVNYEWLTDHFDGSMIKRIMPYCTKSLYPVVFTLRDDVRAIIVKALAENDV